MFRISKIKRSNGSAGTRNSMTCNFILTTSLSVQLLLLLLFRTSTQPNQVNYQTICDLYAEVVGVLAQSRSVRLRRRRRKNECRSYSFASVKRRFMLELNNLRKEPASPSVNANIINLNTGMRFFRVKVNATRTRVRFMRSVFSLR